MVDRSIGYWISLFLLAPLAVWAQKPHVAQHPETVSAILSGSFETRSVPNGRMDVEAGVLRSLYDVAVSVPAGVSAESAARIGLRAYAEAFGFQSDGDDLHLREIKQSPGGTHLTFLQQIAGIPVYNREVKVSLNRAGQPTMILSGYAPNLDISGLELRPRISRAYAAEAAQDFLPNPAETTVQRLVMAPTHPPRLAWQVLGETDAGEWELLLDAHTGRRLYTVRTSTVLKAPGTVFPASSQASFEHKETPETQILVDGTGFVYNPDPLTTSGQAYGPPYTDNNDATNTSLDAERVQVTLSDITQGSDGKYRLTGPYIDVNGTVGTAYTPPVEDGPNDFVYTRDNPFFEAVNVYYHIDQNQRYVQTLGFTNVQNGPIRVNPHGFGTADNSEYRVNGNFLRFGLGGVDDAEDVHVVLHEYMHALINAAAPGLLGHTEGRIFHEGTADYWIGSWVRELHESGTVPAGDWRQLFRWDSGDGQIWNGRRLDKAGVYPDDFIFSFTNPHVDGQIWSAGLMEIYPALGRQNMDRLVLQSLFYLNSTATIPDAAEALLQADEDLFSGQYFDAILDVLTARKFIDPADFVAQIAHTTLPNTEQLGGTVHVDADVTARISPVQSVALFYRHNANDLFTGPIALADQGNDQYTVQLPLPSSPALVEYYLEATDQNNRTVRDPDTAPAVAHRFQAGPDNEPPTITHTPLVDAALIGWPYEVTTTVSDNLGIDSVWVTFDVFTAGQTTPRFSDDFSLMAAGSLYTGFFPTPIANLMQGDRVAYRIHARDQATEANQTLEPTAAEDPFAFVLQGGTTIRSYDVESPEFFTETGAWARGTPDFSLQKAHSGSQVWGTNFGSGYAAAISLSTLELPQVNLSNVAEPYLVFWHWYDLEHNGRAGPFGDPAELIYDLGNIKVSTDGGITWVLLTPEGGYTGESLSGGQNPLAGEKGFGGYSFGWRQEIVPLPSAAQVQIRFEFATDESNTQISTANYGGWFLDDFLITAQKPTDTTVPFVMQQPPSQDVIPVQFGSPAPVVNITAGDDTGIASATVDYTFFSGTPQTNSTQLAMIFTTLDQFSGAMPFIGTASPGDYFEYRFTLTDFAGNSITLPAQNLPPLRLDYRLVEGISVLDGAASTGVWAFSGAWATQPGGTAHPSSLILNPIDLPTNAESLHLVLNHTFNLSQDIGGNVQYSTDDGQTWQVLMPVGGYPATLNGAPVFSGESLAAQSVLFDLSQFAGQQVRLRVDLHHNRALVGAEFWAISATLQQVTDQEEFAIPRALALHANFPNPFAATTTIQFTLPEAQAVTLAVYDVLGRQVALLVDETRDAGTYTVPFDGSHLSNGLYILRLEAGNVVRIGKMTRVR